MASAVFFGSSNSAVRFIYSFATSLLMAVTLNEHGRKVFAAARAPKEFYTIHGATHNDTYRVGGDAYFERLRGFVETVLSTTQP